MSPKFSILITGGTLGLGFQAALEIARQHPDYQIIIASRSDSSSVAASMNSLLKQNNVAYLPLDLASLTQVRTFVEVWENAKYPPIKALLLNAGLQFPEGLKLTKDGMEATFAINHVGHALLFHLLLPSLAQNARVVITSSGTHDPAQKSGLPDAKYTSAEELAHPKPESASMDGRQRYSTSKLANVLWMYALQKRLAASSQKHVSVVAFDPGLMPGTGLAREYSAFLRWVWTRVLPLMLPVLRLLLNPNIHTTKDSGRSLAWLAISDEMEGVSGVYYEGKKEIKSSKDSYDVEKQDELWKWTVKNIAENEEEMRKFDMLC